MLNSLQRELGDLKQLQNHWDTTHRELSVALDRKEGASSTAQARVNGLEQEASLMMAKIAKLEAQKSEAQAREATLQVARSRQIHPLQCPQ